MVKCFQKESELSKPIIQLQEEWNSHKKSYWPCLRSNYKLTQRQQKHNDYGSLFSINPEINMNWSDENWSDIKAVKFGGQA